MLKRGAPLERRVLDADGWAPFAASFAALSRAVQDKAGFRHYPFREAYWPSLLEAAPGQTWAHGWFLDGRPVSFSFYVRDGDRLEAHSVGVDYDINREYELYQNLLYDSVVTGIDVGARTVSYGRTALEMKSNLGAKPQPLRCWARHSGPLRNRLIRPLFHYLRPSRWTPRDPWKAGD